MLSINTACLDRAQDELASTDECGAISELDLRALGLLTGGNSVVILGTGFCARAGEFCGVTPVDFGPNNSAADLRRRRPTSITATSPAPAPST